jgi:hypothetical protein
MRNAMRVVPAGGGGQWCYDQPWNGKTIQFCSHNEVSLVQKVKEFRVTNDLDAENAEADIINHFKLMKSAQPRQETSLRVRVTGWKSNRQFSKNSLVDPEISEERAKICLGCPYNVVDWADDCKECTSKTIRDLASIRQGRATSYDSRLGACSIFGHCNKTAVQLDESSLKHRVNNIERAPDFCWLKKL